MGRMLAKINDKFVVCETVSDDEAAITPEFDTEEELIEHLVAEGTTWDAPWTRQQAERFVKEDKWAPSVVIIDRKVLKGYEI